MQIFVCGGGGGWVGRGGRGRLVDGSDWSESAT